MKQVTLERVKDATREEIMAEKYFWLDDWSATGISFGQWKSDPDVVHHIYNRLGKYYFERALDASNLHDEDVAVRVYFENQTNRGECGGAQNGDTEVNRQAYLQHDTPSFFKKLFAMWPQVDEWNFEFEGFIQSFAEFGFTAHVPFARRFVVEQIGRIQQYSYTSFKDASSFECLAYHHPEQAKLMLEEEEALELAIPAAVSSKKEARL